MTLPDTSAPAIAARGLMVARGVLLLLAGGAFCWLALVDPVVVRQLGWLPAKLSPSLGLIVVAAWLAVSALELAWLRSRGASTSGNGFHLIVDVVAITVLLMATGGARNPFTVIYFVPLTLATQVSARWTWVVAGLTIACFASMFAYPGLGPQAAGPHAHHFAGHMRGMWYAFAASGALMTLFVHRIARALDAQRAELEALRAQAMEDRHLAAIGALAAGAAHELGTPLGTVSMLSEELPHLDGAARDEALVDMQRELQRAKEILHRMRTPAGNVDALHDAAPWPLTELPRALEDSAAPLTLAWDLPPPVAQLQLTLPRVVVEQLLGELIRNAVRAATRNAAAPEPVALRVRRHEGGVEFRVIDRGPGMDAQMLEAAFEPLATTRPEGMGLGLYLARGHARALGGQLDIESELGLGTTATLRLPASLVAASEPA